MADLGHRSEFYNKDYRKTTRKVLSFLGTEDRKLVSEFIAWKRAKDSISWKRVEKIAYHLAGWRRRGFLQVPFRKAEKGDIIAAINRLEDYLQPGCGKPYGHDTKNDYKKILKYFYTWLEGEDQEVAPKKVRWIKVRKQRSQKEEKVPLTEEEVRKLLEAAKNPRFPPALVPIIAISAEMGGRVGEIANGRKIKDILETERAVRFNITGKTNARRPALGWSLPYLREYLNKHPGRNDPEAPLWVGRRGVPMKYALILRNIKKIAQAAGITKKVHPHIMRHTSITVFTRDGVPGSINERYHGFVPGSRAFAGYDHSNTEDADSYVLGKAGLQERKEPETDTRIRICFRCGYENGFSAETCTRCGLVLSLDKAEEYEERLLKAQEKAFEAIAKRAVEKIMKKR